MLIDEKDNAWLIDLGRGYPRVENDMAGTVARDVASIAELKRPLFPSS